MTPVILRRDPGAVQEAAEVFGSLTFFQSELLGPADQEMLEGYTTLGFLSAKTSTLRLGLLVTGVTYRHPGLLAKVVTTLDVLSGGRAQLGIGAGWYEREHRGLGIPFPPIGERLGRLEETLQICLQMWGDDNGPYHGKYYELAETLNEPQSIQRPHPPILIAGGGEKKMLRLVARYADAANLFTMEGVDGVRHKLEVLRRHCENERRDYDAIEKTILYTASLPTGDVADAFVGEMARYADIGVDTVILMPGGDHPVEGVKQLGPVIRRLAEL